MSLRDGILQDERQSGCSHLEVEVDKVKLEVESSTSGTSGDNCGIEKVNYGDLVYRALKERNELFKRMEKCTPKVEEGT